MTEKVQFYGKMLYSMSDNPRLLMLRQDLDDDAAVAVWFAAWCMAGNCQSDRQLITDGEAVTPEEFAVICRFDRTFTDKCFERMVARGLMTFEDGIYSLLNWDSTKPSESQTKVGARERQRRCRKRRAALKRGEQVEVVQPLFPNPQTLQLVKPAEPEESTSTNFEHAKHAKTAKAVSLGDFDEFYAAYPRKVGRGRAEKEDRAALKFGTHYDLMVGLISQPPKMNRTEQKFIPHPATWLSGKRWMDEDAAAAARDESNVSTASWY